MISEIDADSNMSGRTWTPVRIVPVNPAPPVNKMAAWCLQAVHWAMCQRTDALGGSRRWWFIGRPERWWTNGNHIMSPSTQQLIRSSRTIVYQSLRCLLYNVTVNLCRSLSSWSSSCKGASELFRIACPYKITWTKYKFKRQLLLEQIYINLYKYIYLSRSNGLRGLHFQWQVL